MGEQVAKNDAIVHPEQIVFDAFQFTRREFGENLHWKIIIHYILDGVSNEPVCFNMNIILNNDKQQQHQRNTALHCIVVVSYIQHDANEALWRLLFRI